jgi:hypothetical protein
MKLRDLLTICRSRLEEAATIIEHEAKLTPKQRERLGRQYRAVIKEIEGRMKDL